MSERPSPNSSVCLITAYKCWTALIFITYRWAQQKRKIVGQTYLVCKLLYGCPPSCSTQLTVWYSSNVGDRDARGSKRFSKPIMYDTEPGYCDWVTLLPPKTWKNLFGRDLAKPTWLTSSEIPWEHNGGNVQTEKVKIIISSVIMFRQNKPEPYIESHDALTA